MATKPFLNADDWAKAPAKLRAPEVVLTGDESQIAQIPSQEFSLWLQDRLLMRLASHASWKASDPVALGSWSRGELSPKSDIDLLFTGNEAEVLKLVTDFSKQGLKLRYRMPADRNDWTKGVEAFDVLALLGAKALLPNSELANQKQKIRDDLKSVRKSILRAMALERKNRTERYDSITNYLEPNLKYGAGGLRDLEQALALRLLYPERFESSDDHHAFDVLLYYKRFFLLVRQKLHLTEGASDLLSAPEQAPIAKWLGYASPRDFMKEIQKVSPA